MWFDSAFYIATLKRTGELSERRALPMPAAQVGAAGIRSAVFIGLDGGGLPRDAMLVTDSAITSLPLPEGLHQPRVSFDGTDYQFVGYDASGGLHVVSLDEDGEFGADQPLLPRVDPTSAKLDIVSDDDGNTVIFHSDNAGWNASRLSATRDSLMWTAAVPKYGLGNPVWLPGDQAVWIPDTTPVQLTNNGDLVRPPFTTYSDHLLPGADVLLGGTVLSAPQTSTSSDGRRRRITRYEETGIERPTDATFVEDAVGMGDRIAAFEQTHEPSTVYVRLYALDGTPLVQHTIAVGPPATKVRVCPSDPTEAD